MPVLTAQSQSVTEDGSLLTGQMVATDVDTGDHTLPSVSPMRSMAFTLNADGSYSFEPIDAAYQTLAQGLTETLTIPVQRDRQCRRNRHTKQPWLSLSAAATHA
ncbi:hypothetical protein HT094_01110, partial [Shewanella sp. ZOR0012]|nr:hypothetical protein [Shewanella sp. ZOR0012]